MISMLLNNVLWAVSVFIAIIVWRKTRDSSWIFMILAVFLFYTAVIFKTFVFFGLIRSDIFVYHQIDMFSVLSETIPVLFIIVSLSIKAVKNSER